MTLTKTDLSKLGELIDNKLATQNLSRVGELIDNKLATQDLSRVGKLIDNKLAMQKDDIIDDVREELTRFKSDMFTKIDPILKEVKTNREERVLINNRLTKVELKLATN